MGGPDLTRRSDLMVGVLLPKGCIQSWSSVMNSCDGGPEPERGGVLVREPSHLATGSCVRDYERRIVGNFQLRL